MWTLFEPIHAVSYFAPQARSAYEKAGLRGFWRGYFAGRAAPLGAAGTAVVAASFFNFAPAFVARAIPGVWELVTPDEAVRIRVAGATEALHDLLAGQEAGVAAAAGLLWRAIGELDFSGRVLAAADAALPVPEDGLARLWQAATVLREHRGDGHFAVLAAADIDGCEAVALRCCLDLRREDLQPVRGWTDEAWDEALARLAERGWLGADGKLTSAGRAAHAAVENATDWAAARPWARLGPEATAELAADPGRRQAADDVPHLVAAARVEPGRRFVQVEHPRPADQAGGQVQAPAHAAGVRLTARSAASVSRKEASRSRARLRAAGRDWPVSRPMSMRFSSPVSVSSTDAYCPVSPVTCRTWCAWLTTSWPQTVARPPSGRTSVARIRTAVVFPAPFGPSRPNTEPVRTNRSIPSSARVWPNRLTSPSATIEYVMPPCWDEPLTAHPDPADAP